ncbi:hypothetical protein RW1_007_02300 [Rhodococcus wratislaviensis NBRC 100605]|uniref:Uncharacterized protein n=1 Tax=Rhodococcus wratislaviensis NBRC 100605 TaxID=1219028 RepID=X0QY87_RHOWR|nr:hypothetical protein RW1_007_02300 [Rhodococcus wratislaviensis NBRC 100605]
MRAAENFYRAQKGRRNRMGGRRRRSKFSLTRDAVVAIELRSITGAIERRRTSGTRIRALRVVRTGAAASGPPHSTMKPGAALGGTGLGTRRTAPSAARMALHCDGS